MIEKLDNKYLSEAYKIEVENFTYVWDFDFFKQQVLFNQNNYFYVKIVDGEIIGFIGVHKVLDNFDILTIAIKKSHQRLNYGSQLIQFIIDFAKNNDIKTISLEVNVNNFAAIKLYEKYGFKIKRVIKNYYWQNNEDGYLMVRE